MIAGRADSSPCGTRAIQVRAMVAHTAKDMVSGRTRWAFNVSNRHVASPISTVRVPHRFVDHVDPLDVVAAVGAYTCGDQCSMVQ
jgi:hypothetical protein